MLRRAAGGRPGAARLFGEAGGQALTTGRAGVAVGLPTEAWGLLDGCDDLGPRAEILLLRQRSQCHGGLADTAAEPADPEAARTVSDRAAPAVSDRAARAVSDRGVPAVSDRAAPARAA